MVSDAQGNRSMAIDNGGPRGQLAEVCWGPGLSVNTAHCTQDDG